VDRKPSTEYQWLMLRSIQKDERASGAFIWGSPGLGPTPFPALMWADRWQRVSRDDSGVGLDERHAALPLLMLALFGLAMAFRRRPMGRR
jgi:hypothetical protein